MVRKPPQVRDWLDLGSGHRELIEAWRTLVAEENPSPAAVRKARQVMFDAQRSNTLPPLWIRRFIADNLQYGYSSALVRKAQVRQVKAAGIIAETERLVRKHEISRTKAKDKVVADPKFKLKTVKALEQRVRRAKRAREKGDKN
jgi:hypothetical protein